MNLTIQDLDNIKKNCDRLSHLVEDIKKSYYPDNPERKLFVSRSDYEASLKIKNQLPQDFYYFRCFDVFAQIVFDKSSEKYIIYLDGFYSHLLDKYKRLQRSQKSFIISEDFEETFELFRDVIEDIFSNKVLQNELF